MNERTKWPVLTGDEIARRIKIGRERRADTARRIRRYFEERNEAIRKARELEAAINFQGPSDDEL